MLIFGLIPDAFGSKGGIALYNRDLLSAICEVDKTNKVVAIPRFMNEKREGMPSNLIYITEGIDGKLRYLQAVLKAALKTRKADIVLCGHINLLPLAYLAARWLKAKLVLEIYGVDAWEPTGNPWSDKLISTVDAVLSISKVTLDRFRFWSGIDTARCYIIPNAIHLEEYGIRPGRSDLLTRYSLHGKMVIMTLGRMSSREQYKGFDEVLEVMPRLLENCPNLVYLAVGDGDDRKRLMAKAEGLGVLKNVIFPGYVAEEEKADHYRLADAYVMPSYGEGFGFVILEAMACGVPVVASKLDGTYEAVREGELGEVVDPHDPDQVTMAILRALDKVKKIPTGLRFFSYDVFVGRVGELLADTMMV